MAVFKVFSIHLAARQGNLKRLRRLIKCGVSVDSRDSRGCTPLHLAVQGNQYEVADFLIRSKCDLDLKDNDGHTPLWEAAMRSMVVVNLLLDHGAKVSCAVSNDWTLLHIASLNGWVPTVQRIVESGEAVLNAATDYGETPLILAAMDCSGSSSECKEVADLLIRAGADVNRRDSEKMTALHWAAHTSKAHLVQVLLEKEGLDLNPQDEKGKTPLHAACWERHTGVLKQLLVAGADPKIKNNNNETALSVIIKQERRNLEVIRLFIEHDAFFEDCDYVRLSNNPFLKENVLKDVDLCTKSIVNKFHSLSLPSLYSISYFSKQLPSLEKFKLNTRQIDDVENSVKFEIQTNNFCNLVKACPMALTVFCVKSLLSCQK